METRPHSPETAAFVASSLEAWNRFFSAGDDQSDVDSVLQNPSMPEDFDSFTEDSVDEALLSVLPTPSMPPKSDQTYEKLESIMGLSYLELAELDILRLEAIVKDVYKLLRDAILTGYSRRWAEFDSWLDFGHKLSKVLLAKKAAAMPDEEDYDGDVDSEELSDCEDPHFSLVEIEEDSGDGGFIRELYTRDLKVLGWDDVLLILHNDKAGLTRDDCTLGRFKKAAPITSLPDTLPPSSHLPTLTPATVPRATHHSSRLSTTAAAAQMAARNAQTAAAHTTGSPHKPGQRTSAHISTRCAMELPRTVTVALLTPGRAAGIGGGGARRARSSTSSPVMRTAKTRGGAAARNMALWDEAIL
ncbi:hypothetical protein H4582DRAFT_2051225 [Lactarius indigo]|nr:hypothetical protein H4582DRAFT_2051225 [Lactarius indigo]